MIVIMAGLPGTGKTTLARELAARCSGRVLSKDAVRQAVFHADEIKYSTQQDDACLDMMLATAGYLCEQSRTLTIVLDGRPFSRRYQIDNVVQAARRLHQAWRILECVCPEQIARERIEADAQAATHPATNRDFNLYLQVKNRFEEITLPKTVIDTSQPLESCIRQALAAIG